MGQLLSHPLTEKTIIYNDYQLNYNPPGESHHLSAPKSHFLNRRPSSSSSTHEDAHKRSKKINNTLSPQFFNCIGSMQGYRLTQEDAHLIANFSNHLHIRFSNPFTKQTDHLTLALFGVFDGHGGDECSKFVSGQERADQGLSKWITYSFENHRYGSFEDDPKQYKRLFHTLDGLISQILKDSFMLQDRELYSHFANSPCGSTGIVAVIINGEKLYVANVGDSRCILSSKSKGVKNLSFDHKPQHIGELIRINDNGGTVSLGRVGGVLALSRAFGDFQFKRGVSYTTVHGQASRNSTPAQEAQVTVEPDVMPHQIDFSNDEFLVLACDGIWDIYSNKTLVQFIKYHLTLGLKLDEIVTKLLDHGISCADSNTGVGFDNMTVIIVVLNKPGESLAQWYSKMKTRLEREKGLMG